MKIGFIGLGIMGKPMVRNLLKAGHEVIVYDVINANIKAVITDGAIEAGSSREVAEQCSLIITMLPNSPHVKTVVLGENGVLEGAKEGTILIDMSSIAPYASQEIYKACKTKGVRMIDAPVSGGEPKAIDGTLSIMCGGKKEVFDKYTDLLKAMGSSVVYVGEIGSGNVAKLANQMVVAANIGICAEAMTFAKKMGTDPELVYQAIRGGLAGSTVMDAKVPMMLAGNYKPGFRIDLHIKDLNNALNASHAINMPVPMTAHMMEVMQELKNHDEGSCDHDDIIRYYERMTGVSIVKEK